MKRIVVVKLVPSPDQFAALESTLVLCNEVANEVAGWAQSRRLRSRRALQVALYPMVKARGLSAQPALHVLRKVADAYTTRQANLTNGNYGRPGSKRYTAVAGTAVAFRPQFATDINHQLSKTIVARAQRTGRGIAIEDLSGIRDRVRLARRQRTQLHSWGYAQLRAQITYKAEMSGVPVAVVDPRNTSRTCSHCGYCDKANRVSQATFRCRHCQWTGHADHNAARNIAALGHRTYRAAQSTAPIAATPPTASGNVSSKPGPSGPSS